MTNTRSFLLILWIAPAAFLWGCATEQTVSRNFTGQYEEIAAKVNEAEMLGARDCAPRDLANARVELDQALHEANEPHYPRSWVQAEFDKARIAADKLLAGRKLRASQGACP